MKISLILGLAVLCLSLVDGLWLRRRLTRRVRSSCTQPKVVGPCRAAFRRYFYNTKTGKCQAFIYGGCFGNGNNYRTLKKCQKTCGRSARANPCNQPKVSGPCYALFKRYYYNTRKGRCQPFIYGGCLGNKNNFRSLRHCRMACGSSSRVDPCKQPKVTGPCRALFRRYYFNRVIGKCQKFIYGGCRGNSNNFWSIKQCRQKCM